MSREELSQDEVDRLLQDTSSSQLSEIATYTEILALAKLAVDDPAMITDAEIEKLARALIFYLAGKGTD